MKVIALTAQPNVFITVPIEALVEAGIGPNDVIEIYAEDDKVIIQKVEPEDAESFVCDEDCVNWPFQIVDCAHEKAA